MQSPNRLLALLPDNCYRTIAADLEGVHLSQDEVQYKAHGTVGYAYFPIDGVLSALTIMENGDAIEVATVGNEGMVGQGGAIGLDISPNEVLAQIAGKALRIRIDRLK